MYSFVPNFWTTIKVHRLNVCVTVQNFVKIGQRVVEILQCFDFQIVALHHLGFFKFEFLNSYWGLEVQYASPYQILSNWLNGCVYIAHTHTHFTALWTLFGTTRVSWYQKIHFTIFWIFQCKMKISQADTPTIQTNWCPHLCHPYHYYAGCHSWHNPPNLSWLGTITKYAGLHTGWLGLRIYSI